MYFILIFTLLFNVSQELLEDHPGYIDLSKSQVNLYLNNIERGIDVDANLWALVKVTENKPKIHEYALDRIKKGSYHSDALKTFIKANYENDKLISELVFSTGSKPLLLEILLKQTDKNSRIQIRSKFLEKFNLTSEKGINYPVLVNKIINGSEIDSTVLPYERIQLPHLILINGIYDSSDPTILSEEYKRNALNKWKNIVSGSEHHDVSNALKNATFIILSFNLVEFSDELKGLYNFLQSDQLIPNSMFKYRTLRYFDYLIYSNGYYYLSLNIIKYHAAPLAVYLGSKKLELSALMYLAADLINIGKISEAQVVNLKILEESEKYDIQVNKATLYSNLGLTYKESGEFSKYLDLQLRALKEANNQGNIDRRLEILSYLYLYYKERKDYKNAILYLTEAKNLAEEYGKPVQVGRLHMYLGILYRDFEDNFDKSLKHFELAGNYLDHENDYVFYLQLLDEKATLFKKLNNYDLSRDLYFTKIKLSKSKDKAALEAYLQIISLELELGNLKSAERLLSIIETYDFSQLDFRDIIKARTVKSDFLSRTGKVEEAYNIMKPAIQRVVERAKSSRDLQSGYWNVDSQYLDAFSLMADLLIETDRNEDAVEILDKLKTINDASLYQNPMVKSSLLDESELLQYKQLTDQLDLLRKKQLLASERDQLSLQSKIDQLTAQKNVLDRKISSLVDRNPISIEEVQRRITGRELVLHVTELQDQYYIARISRHDVSFKKVALDSTLRAKFSNAIENMSIGKTDLNELSQISDILDIESIPAWVERLTVIPDSYLYQLPIDALPIKSEGFGYSYGGATYVVEKFKTHYLTSLNDFRSNNAPRKKYAMDFAGYGVSQFPSYTNKQNLMPLPHAESEVSTIVGNLSNMTNRKAYLDTASTEQVFKETAPNARILHLATHSELSDRDPLFSTIYMSADNQTENEDFSGQIFAYELFELNLANDLIMLNSCESGSGSYLQGTGVMGISRALRYAGANSLILNLWSVNDMMASEFAIEFYKNINEGQTKDEALRQAKLYFLKNKNANPHYWGPYILIGNRDALVNPNRETNIYFAGAFMLFFITIASISLLQDRREKAA